MGRFSLEESPEEEGVLKKRKYNRGKMVASESDEELEEEEEVSCEEREEEENDEGGDEEIGDAEAGRGLGGVSREGELTFRIDTDVLDCSICFEPLRPPIFQCSNGHVACSSCCPKLLNKCHVCSRNIGYRRCLALEKVIESIKVQCQYVNNGCKVIISFAEKASHEETCSHAPLFCPISDCTFSGSKQLLADHAVRVHRNALTKFFYNQPFMITLPSQKPFMVLLGDDGHVFLLLNRFETCPGNALSLICIDSSNTERVFTYELNVHCRGSSLQIRTSAEKLKKWSGLHPTKAFLIIPEDFYTYKLGIGIHVCIQKSSGTQI